MAGSDLQYNQSTTPRAGPAGVGRAVCMGGGGVGGGVSLRPGVCMCACVRACVRACACAWRGDLPAGLVVLPCSPGGPPGAAEGRPHAPAHAPGAGPVLFARGGPLATVVGRQHGTADPPLDRGRSLPVTRLLLDRDCSLSDRDRSFSDLDPGRRGPALQTVTAERLARQPVPASAGRAGRSDSKSFLAAASRARPTSPRAGPRGHLSFQRIQVKSSSAGLLLRAVTLSASVPGRRIS